MTKALVETLEDILIEEGMVYDEDGAIDLFLKNEFLISDKTEQYVHVDVKIEMNGWDSPTFNIVLIPTKPMKSQQLMRAIELGKVVCFGTPELWEDIDLYHANKNFAKSYIDCSDGKFICNDLMVGEEMGGIETVNQAKALALGCYSKQIRMRWQNSFTYTHPA